MKVKSLSRKLLTRVLSFYFILTVGVTGIQIIAEYFNTKNHINSELLTLEKTISGSLTRAVWELNNQQVIDISEGLVAIPMIKGITVTDESNNIITQLGEVISPEKSSIRNMALDDASEGISSVTEGLFGHSFPLVFEFSGRTTSVGRVTLLSSNAVIFSRIEVGLYFLIGNAIVKTAFLVFLFTLAFNKLLTTPLKELTRQISQIDLDDPEASKLHSMNYEKNELNVLEDAYNNLINELVEFKEKLAQSQLETDKAKEQIDENNLLLEQEVARKTSSLSSTMLKMEVQQKELREQKKTLQEENLRHSKTEKTLTTTNKDLIHSIKELNKAKERLLEAEKMASLGELSAEISHEVITPIGISITSSSYLSEQISHLQQSLDENKISRKSIESFIQNALNSTKLLNNNLHRASELVTSFKHIATDQTRDKIRLINVSNYIDEIIQSIHPKLKKTSHSIKVDCDENIDICSHPGAIAQILINLIINSIIHGFEQINRGQITIDVKYYHHKLLIDYKDNGHGLSEETKEKLFDAFYTTKSNKGGTGLGTHIIKNLVTDTLNGTITAHSEINKGLSYHIEIPDMRT
ncbi:ATP-binding protein [Colwellia sp. 4_MG-2023]|uniref:sensor histidine kinase n=1 Tax=unclassified Colwellia TaxID=196834 RepID=UPI001C0897AB|nr:MULTISPECIES: HAMP domain-containing sensor histidine kinase [unclassified Colwellia]MBU2923155.1 sensor histidine kinase [Colwellia sp. C2M11]MDO6506635.1 ATP-binding protein [Colwellia sp. 5_MG-2023]MDO6555461.1 ATP-binding protein [Colwellia sp. 4_MG-2023]MDO6651416.1 ATP-binding protein [Colwellia sp. 3_MG-2023]MDO6664161.1 ATP-binding protein [Colwellia sp. 2_MG-2023]